MQKLWKTLGFLMAFTLLCAIAARLLTRGETLGEYAQNNPEIAYATPKTTADQGPSPLSDPLSAATADKEALPGTSPAATQIPDDKPAAQETLAYFYYEPLSEDIIARITGISYPVTRENAAELTIPAINIIDNEEEIAVSYDELRYMSVLHHDFHGEIQTGELICHKEIAQDLLEIFYELYLNEYQIEKIQLVDEYNGDDTASMTANNTSCFNYRVVDGTSNLSKHAFGCAIDINPFYNPYVVYNRGENKETYISPPGSEIYADRTQDFPYKIDENDLCYKLFTERGFTWGGNWNSSKDYQHFQKVIR